jgi:hypothetical protein
MTHKKPVCEFCGEYKKCVCRFETCALCKESYSNFDPDESHQIFEYRGVFSCSKCFDEVCAKRDEQRERVMEITNASIKSQRVGEFVNNRGKYHIGNVASDGLPVIKVREPLALQEYEEGKL